MTSAPTGAAPGSSTKMQRTSSISSFAPEQVFVAQKVSEAQLLGLKFGLGAGVERAVLGTQLLGRVTCHPERLFVGHCWFRPGMRSRLVVCLSLPGVQSRREVQFQAASRLSVSG